jgi:adenylate kinase family enzyme
MLTRKLKLSKILIFGNSGSGKSTLAKKICQTSCLAHLDLDSLAWQATNPPERKEIKESEKGILDFIQSYDNWVIEGCYTDLLELLSEQTDEIIYLNLPVDLCIKNAKSRPWEPHKYASKEAQDANLAMLVDWISQYTERQDTFSKQAHQKFFTEYVGKKSMITDNQ